MARRSKAKSGAAGFDSEAWRMFHSDKGKTGPKLLLVGQPEAAALLKAMLESLRPGEHVSWKRVRDYIRQTHPGAPSSPRPYKLYAELELGWRGSGGA